MHQLSTVQPLWNRTRSGYGDAKTQQRPWTYLNTHYEHFQTSERIQFKPLVTFRIRWTWASNFMLQPLYLRYLLNRSKVGFSIGEKNSYTEAIQPLTYSTDN
jgi:hypothetical protein